MFSLGILLRDSNSECDYGYATREEAQAALIDIQSQLSNDNNDCVVTKSKNLCFRAGAFISAVVLDDDDEGGDDEEPESTEETDPTGERMSNLEKAFHR